MNCSSQERGDRVQAVFCVDGGYAMQLACALWSAVSRCGAPVDAWVIDGGLTAGDRERLGEVVRRARGDSRVTFFSAAEGAFADAVTPGHLTSATYLRLLLGELLPEDVGRVIYLDSDMVVLGDLAALWQMTAGDAVLWVATDQMEPTWGEAPGVRVACKAMGVDPRTPYFNAGVMVLDCGAWRVMDVSARVLDYTNRRAQDITHGDQDGLNAVFAGQWSELPAEWNVQMAAWFRTRELYGRANILHFTGVGKPWNPGYRNARDAGARFFEALCASGWLSRGDLARYVLTRRLPQRATAMGIRARNRLIGGGVR